MWYIFMHFSISTRCSAGSDFQRLVMKICIKKEHNNSRSRSGKEKYLVFQSQKCWSDPPDDQTPRKPLLQQEGICFFFVFCPGVERIPSAASRLLRLRGERLSGVLLDSPGMANIHVLSPTEEQREPDKNISGRKARTVMEVMEDGWWLKEEGRKCLFTGNKEKTDSLAHLMSLTC